MTRLISLYKIPKKVAMPTLCTKVKCTKCKSVSLVTENDVWDNHGDTSLGTLFFPLLFECYTGEFECSICCGAPKINNIPYVFYRHRLEKYKRYTELVKKQSLYEQKKKRSHGDEGKN